MPSLPLPPPPWWWQLRLPLRAGATRGSARRRTTQRGRELRAAGTTGSIVRLRRQGSLAGSSPLPSPPVPPPVPHDGGTCCLRFVLLPRLRPPKRPLLLAACVMLPRQLCARVNPFLVLVVLIPLLLRAPPPPPLAIAPCDGDGPRKGCLPHPLGLQAHVCRRLGSLMRPHAPAPAPTRWGPLASGMGLQVRKAVAPAAAAWAAAAWAVACAADGIAASPLAAHLQLIHVKCKPRIDIEVQLSPIDQTCWPTDLGPSRSIRGSPPWF